MRPVLARSALTVSEMKSMSLLRASCPTCTPALLPHIRHFRNLTWYHELDLSNISLHRQISLLFASDPFPLLRDATRVAWIRDITPVAIDISISLNHLMPDASQ